MSKINFDNIVENDFEVPFYSKLHGKVLEYLEFNNGETLFWKLTRAVGGSDRRMLRLLNEMEKSGEIEVIGKEITLKKRKILNKEVIPVCKACNGKIISFTPKFSQILKEMKEIYSKKPVPTFLFDQRPVTDETTVRRAAYLMWRGDLIGKSIAIVGDDDLTSLAIGLTGMAKEIVVFDIDTRLIDFINLNTKKYNLPVKAIKSDLTENHPKEFIDRFDVFLTDPTPKPDAFELFLSIGIKLLKNNGGVGYVSFFPSHQDISIEFQKILTKYDLIVTDMIPKFTEYDFIPETYRNSDFDLLKKLDAGGNRISFHENQTRFEVGEKSKMIVEHEKKHKSLDFMGKATKRVLSDIEKDPAYKKGEKDFVINTARSMRDGKVC